jgi:predicted ATPase
VTGLALNRREGLVLVQAVAGNAAVPDELMTEVLERADGVPLFVEELTKAVLETVDRKGHDGGPVRSSGSNRAAAPIAGAQHAPIRGRIH